MSADNWAECPRCLDQNPDSDCRTFREDYDFTGAEEGTITADYRGRCKVCDLEVKFTYDVPFYPVRYP